MVVSDVGCMGGCAVVVDGMWAAVLFVGIGSMDETDPKLLTTLMRLGLAPTAGPCARVAKLAWVPKVVATIANDF